MRAVASAWIVAFKIFNTLMFLSSRNEGIGSTKLMPPRYHLGELQQITNVKQDILICDQDFKLTIDHHPSDRNWGFAATDSAEGLACDRQTSIQMMVNWSYFKGATFVLTKFNDFSQFVTGIRWMFHFCIQKRLPKPTNSFVYDLCSSLRMCFCAGRYPISRPDIWLIQVHLQGVWKSHTIEIQSLTQAQHGTFKRWSQFDLGQR